jgi:RHS repeat-associated protein
MRSGRWRAGATAGYLIGCLVGVFTLAFGVALAQGSPSGGGSGASSSDASLSGESSSALGGPLVVAGSPMEGEQLRAQEQTKLASPEAVAAREASRTKFEKLNSGQAAKLAGEAFPAVVGEPAGGPPALPAGESIVSYPMDNTAQVDLPGGKHGVIESSVPIALETSPGRRTPVDLGLSEAGSAFEAMKPVVGVRIPKRLAAGVALAGTGVSLTPVDANGAALGGSEGAIDGATVLYANTQTDADTVVKPTTTGFETDTVLRSVESPEALYYKVGLPEGASIVQAKDGSGTVEVVKEGATLATIAAPGARDAAGTSVPVSMSVSGDTLVLSVASHAAEYQYPIDVDPTVSDDQLVREFGEASNWHEEVTSSAFKISEIGSGYEGEVRDADSGTTYARGEWGAIAYETQGESHIYEFHSRTSASNTGSNIENKLLVLSEGKSTEKELVTGSSYAWTEETLCLEAGCATGKVEAANKHNAAEFRQIATSSGSEFSSSIKEEYVGIVQEKGPTITSVNTTSKTIAGEPNALYPGTWTGPRRGAAELTATDPGVGLSRYSGFQGSSPNKAGWNPVGGNLANICYGVQCSQSGTAQFFWQEGLPSGEDTVEFWARDGVGLTSTKVSEKVKVDATSPYEVTLTGLPANKELGNGQVKLKATARDGSEAFSGSGIESLVLKVDGQAVGKPSGSCSPGPCTATGEWTVSGTEFPGGQHKISVTATSYAGDSTTGAEYTEDTGHPAVPVALGPGSVSPQTGEFFLNATDVSLGAPGGGLSLKRSYLSSHLAAGAEGPLGPQWAMSVGGSESLTKGAEGTVVLTGGEGQQSVFTSKGKGEFNSPPLSASLVLTEVLESEKTKEFLLKDASGTITKFKLPSGGTGNTYVPVTLEGPGATNVTTYAFKTVGGITEPTELLGPVPAGVSCTAGLVKGCRALGFVYDTKTTATGNGASEWGEYEGRLKEVTFTAWEPTSGKMKTTAVAEYVYDKEGRLRGEWDPRVSPALETTYGYDAAGHVTALTPPGQQPWLFDYGTATGDPRARIVSVTRPSASTAAGNGSAPVNTTAPALSTVTARVGVPLSVSTGTWSNSPLSYSYQWETCPTEVEGKRVCTAILGATSQTYTPTEQNVRLAATVTASNADGAVAVASSNKGNYSLPSLTFKEAASFAKEGSSEGQVKEADAIAAESASTSEGNVWVADTGNNRVEEFSASGTFVKTFGWDVGGKAEFQDCTSKCQAGTAGSGNGQFEKPVGIALSENDKYVYVSDAGNKRIQVFEAKTGKYVSQYKLPGIGVPAGIAVGKLQSLEPNAVFLCVALTNNGTAKCLFIEKEGAEVIESMTFGGAGSGNGKLKEPTDLAISEEGKSNGEGNEVYVADKGNHRVEIFKPDYSDLSHLEYAGQFGTEGSGEGLLSTPESIALEPRSGAFSAVDGHVFVTDPGNKRVQESAVSGTGPYDWNFGSGQQSVVISQKSGTGDGDLYVLSAATAGTTKIAKWVPEAGAAAGPPAPPNPGTSAVSTVEYHVPVSGTGAPYAMGKTEVEAWGQKDDPAEATAIFPPDEPMGWPAKDYKRAAVLYLDANARTVNTATPGGAITTTEYNSKNDVERSLSADNRAAALKEGSKSAETSKLLDTENTYNAEGTELLSTLGPQHTIQLPGGTHALARDHKQYYYNEGAPTEGGPYGLPTKTTEGAEYSGKEEDIRETSTSYSGQTNLGWKLHKPTSVTTDPKGLKLTHTTVYEPTTGEVKETKSPAGSAAGESSSWTYSTQFGNTGSESEKLNHPSSAAIDSHGNIWVTDSYGRVVELSPSGAFVKSFGSYGSGSDQFKIPDGIAINPTTKNMYIGDEENNRIDELNEKGEFVRAFGFGVLNGKSELQTCTTTCEVGLAGPGAGEMNEPQGVAIESSGNVWVTDYVNNRVDEFNEKGEFIAAFGFGVNGKEEEATCTTSCQAGKAGSQNGEFNGPAYLTFAAGNLYVTDLNNDRVEEFNTSRKYVAKFGEKGTGNGQFSYPGGITADSAGHLYVDDGGNSRVEEFSSVGAYIAQVGTAGTGNGQLKEPEGAVVSSAGDLYVVDHGNSRIEEWTPGSGNSGAHDTQTIYYTTAANTEYKECGEHAEWANLPCESRPAKQPETGGLPNLPVSVSTYNIWDEPEKTTETVGSSTRTKTATYDGAGRPKTSTTSSTVGIALPTVTNEYSSETGALVKLCTNEGKACSEGKPKTIASVYNKLGELTSYTDADENTATYEYDIDGRTTKVNDGKGTQTYTYETTPSYTGALTKLVDSAAGTFTATYDTEGNMLTEGYPNGMNADYTYNQTGTPTSLEYIKATHCTEKCTWFSDSVVPSIHGQWAEQTSTLSHQAYTYDTDGRLTQVQNTPVGKGCTTRAYAYEEETNRTSLKTYEPNAKNECATEKDTEEKHTYDVGNRLTDTGTKYSEFGNITNLPATDAGGAELKSSFYTDNQLQSQTQCPETPVKGSCPVEEQTIGYNLDPAGRTREVVKTGKKAEVLVNHYAGPGGTPAWTVNTSGEWMRNISGIGGFAAVQNNGETPVLQLTNLHGDIVATAYLSETATALASSADTSEFGVPTTSLPPKYSWLGADEIPTELPSGIMDMGARSYVPQLGRFLQPDPRPGGSANAYTYTFGDPVNSSDPSGELTYGFSGWLSAANNQQAQEVVAREVARETLEREEAERRAAEAQAAAEAVAGPQYGGEEEEWEEEGEEEYEYASYHHGGEAESGEGHVEPAVLVQSLGVETSGEGEGTTAPGSTVPLCKVGSEGPCSLLAGGRRCLKANGGTFKCPNRMKACPSNNCKPPPGREKPGFATCKQVGGPGPEAGLADDLPPTKKECEEYFGNVSGSEPNIPPPWW